MQDYKNIGNGSHILRYEISDDSILIEFKSSKSLPYSFYLYTYKSTGVVKIEKMKTLAVNGSGLASFIKTEVKNAYEKRY